jgi:signal transduction histidine kinase
VASSEVPSVGDAIDQFSDGYYELDREFRYRRVNAAGARLARMTVEGMVGRRVVDLFDDIEPSPVHQAVKRVMAGGPVEQVEIYYEPLHIWAINNVHPLADGVAILSRDISAQKVLEQNLQFLAQASKVLTSSLDYEQTLQMVTSLAVPHIADWCAVDMLSGSDTVELLALAHVDPAKVRWARELREREPVDLSAPGGLGNVLRTCRSEFHPEISEDMIVAAARDEETLELIRSIGFSSVMIVPLVIEEQAIGAITFVAAESNRKFVPADLAMAEELASRAVLAIQNARLYRTSQQAVALRDDFIDVASHELKTPVTSLKVFAEVLQRQAEKRGDEGTARSLARMNAQIDRLSGLIANLLDVSRVDSDRLEHRPSEVALCELIEEVVGVMQETSPRHLISIEGTAHAPIFGDRERLGQVFTNLIANAVKYSPNADQVVLRIGGTDVSVTVDVEDFGIGISPADQARIFDRFYRVSSPREMTFPGLGIGLYISSQIVKRHGGTLAVRSNGRQGSVFRVTLPAAGQVPHEPESEVNTE